TQTKNREQQQASIAAAGKYQWEEHNSKFSVEDIHAYVNSTKPHATNPGGLARSLYRSGDEDDQIALWLTRQDQQKCERPEPKQANIEELLHLAEEMRREYPNPADRPEWVIELLTSAEAIKAEKEEETMKVVINEVACRQEGCESHITTELHVIAENQADLKVVEKLIENLNKITTEEGYSKDGIETDKTTAFPNINDHMIH